MATLRSENSGRRRFCVERSMQVEFCYPIYGITKFLEIQRFFKYAIDSVFARTQPDRVGNFSGHKKNRKYFIGKLVFHLFDKGQSIHLRHVVVSDND